MILPFTQDLRKIASEIAQRAKMPKAQEVWALISKAVNCYPPSLKDKACNFVFTEAYKTCKPKKTKPKNKAKLYAAASRLHKPGLDRLPYHEFLRTPYWMAFAKERKQKAGNVCEACNAKTALQIHHLDYTHRGFDHLHPSRTIVLCDGCHRARHGI